MLIECLLPANVWWRHLWTCFHWNTSTWNHKRISGWISSHCLLFGHYSFHRVPTIAFPIYLLWILSQIIRKGMWTQFKFVIIHITAKTLRIAINCVPSLRSCITLRCVCADQRGIADEKEPSSDDQTAKDVQRQEESRLSEALRDYPLAICGA